MFDVDTKSTFTLSCSGSELKKNDLVFELKDWDRGFGGNDPLGSVKVSSSALYSVSMDPSGNGILESPIDPPSDRQGEPAGFLTIKSRSKILAKQEVAAQSETAPLLVPDEDKEVLVEILACRDLIAADKNGLSDPYVKIKLGSKELHKTKHVEKTLNPMFCREDSNFCIITCSAKDLFAKGGIELEAKDYDRGIGRNDSLGHVTVPADLLYSTEHTEDDSIELEFNPPKGHGEKAGFVKIRVRSPTLGDKEDLKAQSSLRGKLAPAKKKNTEEVKFAWVVYT